MKNTFYSWALQKILKRPCPDSYIPLSGKEGRKQNCYTVYLCDESGKEFCWLKRYNNKNDSFSGLALDVNKPIFSISKRYKAAQIFSYKLRITHYYGHKHGVSWESYEDIKSFILNYIFHTLQITMFVKDLFMSFRLLFSNAKDIKLKNRMDILFAILNNYLENGKGMGATTMLTNFNTSLIWAHPDKNKKLNELKFYLNSLKISGDLKLENDKVTYRPLPQAVQTLDKHHTNERRHNDMFLVTCILVGATCVLAIAAITQIAIALS